MLKQNMRSGIGFGIGIGQKFAFTIIELAVQEQEQQQERNRNSTKKRTRKERKAREKKAAGKRDAAEPAACPAMHASHVVGGAGVATRTSTSLEGGRSRSSQDAHCAPILCAQ